MDNSITTLGGLMVAAGQAVSMQGALIVTVVVWIVIAVFISAVIYMSFWHSEWERLDPAHRYNFWQRIVHLGVLPYLIFITGLQAAGKLMVLDLTGAADVYLKAKLAFKECVCVLVTGSDGSQVVHPHPQPASEEKYWPVSKETAAMHKAWKIPGQSSTEEPEPPKVTPVDLGHKKSS